MMDGASAAQNLMLSADLYRVELAAVRCDEQSRHATLAEIYITKKLTERTALAGLSELHIGKDMTTPIEEQIGVGFSYSPTPFISLVPFYRLIAGQARPDHHTQESRPQLDVVLHPSALAI